MVFASKIASIRRTGGEGGRWLSSKDEVAETSQSNEEKHDGERFQKTKEEHRMHTVKRCAAPSCRSLSLDALRKEMCTLFISSPFSVRGWTCFAFLFCLNQHPTMLQTRNGTDSSSLSSAPLLMCTNPQKSEQGNWRLECLTSVACEHASEVPCVLFPRFGTLHCSWLYVVVDHMPMKSNCCGEGKKVFSLGV